MRHENRSGSTRNARHPAVFGKSESFEAQTFAVLRQTQGMPERVRCIGMLGDWCKVENGE